MAINEQLDEFSSNARTTLRSGRRLNAGTADYSEDLMGGNVCGETQTSLSKILLSVEFNMSKQRRTMTRRELRQAEKEIRLA